ncbi:MAG: hypothetical protein AAGA67_13980, partial [Cyanobacteria bacterium P01_F01_bin.153]
VWTLAHIPLDPSTTYFEISNVFINARWVKTEFLRAVGGDRPYGPFELVEQSASTEGRRSHSVCGSNGADSASMMRSSKLSYFLSNWL